MRHVAIVVLSLAAGCARVMSPVTPPTFPTQENYEAQLIARYKNGLPSDVGDTAESRNQVVDDMVYLCNVVYRGYEADAYTESAWTDTGIDVAVLAASAAGALATSGASQAINAAVGAVTGARTAYSKNFLMEQQRSALLLKTTALRDTELDHIEELKHSPIDVWPMSDAMLEVQTYYNDGTIMAALKAFAADAGTQAATAKAKLQARGPR